MRILTQRAEKQPGVQFFFAILKCLCLSKYFPIFFEQIDPHSQDFQEFKLTVLTHILVNIKGCIQPPSLGMRRIFMISIYVRHKKQKAKSREDSLQNLDVIFIGCLI